MATQAVKGLEVMSRIQEPSGRLKLFGKEPAQLHSGHEEPDLVCPVLLCAQSSERDRKLPY